MFNSFVIADIKEGEQIYQSICFTCHGKFLEGGTGFNLMDSVWVHGEQPETILQTLKNGFPEKGMMAFGTIYKDEQLNSVIDYIFSKQAGLRNLQYKIIHTIPSDTKNIDWFSIPATKQGELKPAFINNKLPEVDRFAMTYKGDLLLSEDGPYVLKMRAEGAPEIHLKINGTEVALDFNRNSISQMLQLKKGKHLFEMSYHKTSDYYALEASLEKKGLPTIALSMDTYESMMTQTHILTAMDKPYVVRKHIQQLPAKSIAIAFPEKINTAIDPEFATINALWYGAFLDVAPNINGRGNNPSIKLGEVVFSDQPSIQLLIDGRSTKVNYLKYSTLQQPEFFFKYDEDKFFSIEISAQGQALHLHYKFNPAPKSVDLQLPEQVNLVSKDGQRQSNLFQVSQKKTSSFQLLISK